MERRVISAAKRDQIRAELYEAFYKDNKELFKEDIHAYWHSCSKYVEEHYRTNIRELEYPLTKPQGRMYRLFHK